MSAQPSALAAYNERIRTTSTLQFLERNKNRIGLSSANSVLDKPPLQKINDDIYGHTDPQEFLAAKEKFNGKALVRELVKFTNQAVTDEVFGANQQVEGC